MKRENSFQLTSSLHTISGELDAFLADAQYRRGLSENTITSYRCDLFAASIVITTELSNVTTAEIESFLMGRDEKPSTTNRRIASLRRFFLWAMRQGYCEHNPLDLVEKKQSDVLLPRPVRSTDDLKAIDAAISTTPQPFRLIIILLRETGMRANEVLSLNVGDVSLDVGREGLHIREAKNNIERVVVLSPDVMPKSLRGLRSYLRTLGANAAVNTPLFRSNRGTRISYDTLHYRWMQVCRSAKLIHTVDGKEQPRYTLHQLRHTVGTALIADYPEQIVSRMLGHRDPRSTRRYAEVNDDQVRATLARKKR